MKLQVYKESFVLLEESWENINTTGIHPEIIEIMIELGIIETSRGYIKVKNLQRLQKILRLRESLGVNLPGAAIILDLLERIEKLQDENRRLKLEFSHRS